MLTSGWFADDDTFDVRGFWLMIFYEFSDFWEMSKDELSFGKAKTEGFGAGKDDDRIIVEGSFIDITGMYRFGVRIVFVIRLGHGYCLCSIGQVLS